MKTTSHSRLTLAAGLAIAASMTALLAPVHSASAAGGRAGLETSSGGSTSGRPKPIVRDHRDGYPQWGARCRKNAYKVPGSRC